jgi:hypothetical protein
MRELLAANLAFEIIFAVVRLPIETFANPNETCFLFSF